LAEELSRMPGAPEPAEQRPRRMPRLQPAPPAAATAADAALRRPLKTDDARAAGIVQPRTGDGESVEPSRQKRLKIMVFEALEKK
jgi:hypothetical protein